MRSPRRITAEPADQFIAGRLRRLRRLRSGDTRVPDEVSEYQSVTTLFAISLGCRRKFRCTRCRETPGRASSPMRPTRTTPMPTSAMERQLCRRRCTLPGATTLSPRFPEAHAGLGRGAALQDSTSGRAHLNQAKANAWTPQQKLGYMRQIVGTMQCRARRLTRSRRLEAAIGRQKRRAMDLDAILYSQLRRAGQRQQCERRASMWRRRRRRAQTPLIRSLFRRRGPRLMKHWSPRAELAAPKPRPPPSPARCR